MAFVPQMTPEQRAQALEKAKEARLARAELKRKIKEGEIGLDEALADGAAQRMRVTEFLRAWPGVGDAKAAAFMADAHVDAGRRVKGLGSTQRAKLTDFLGQVSS